VVSPGVRGGGKEAEDDYNGEGCVGELFSHGEE
jgi:hypothetical protein